MITSPTEAEPPLVQHKSYFIATQHFLVDSADTQFCL